MDTASLPPSASSRLSTSSSASQSTSSSSPKTKPQPEPRSLPQEILRVLTKVESRLADVSLQLTFNNTHLERLDNRVEQNHDKVMPRLESNYSNKDLLSAVFAGLIGGIGCVLLGVWLGCWFST